MGSISSTSYMMANKCFDKIYSALTLNKANLYIRYIGFYKLYILHVGKLMFCNYVVKLFQKNHFKNLNISKMSKTLK